ncbi:14839_t:CDS:2 [Acaulospora morrowiae]|uniref:14839_t:CDS:1 n=1 Tax=Acaulospora morrowiae TaxID=94023 RepID=A0A9N9BBH8_9GLOM|nr:14839_t:CDS:2 [Acaulospora morrowiae]
MGQCASISCNFSSYEKTIFEDDGPPFRFINGRRFHNDENSKYVYPNDEEEIGRLELQYWLIKEVWKSIYSAPITPNLIADGRVLDIGCGPGTWILDLATEFKSTIFIGLDISKSFPQNVKPRNAAFIQYNVLNGLPFSNDTFDFVHQSILSAAFTVVQWSQVLAEIVRVLKPGGWIEFMEYDYVIHREGPITQRLNSSLLSFFKSQGINPIISDLLPELLSSSPLLTDIQYDQRPLFLGQWAGNLGALAVEIFGVEITALKEYIQPLMGITDEHFAALKEGFVSEVNRNKSFIKTFRYFCRKVA